MDINSYIRKINQNSNYYVISMDDLAHNSRCIVSD